MMSPDHTAAAVTDARNSASVYDTFVTNRLAVPLHDLPHLYLYKHFASYPSRSESAGCIVTLCLILCSACHRKWKMNVPSDHMKPVKKISSEEEEDCRYFGRTAVDISQRWPHMVSRQARTNNALP